jgi:hypothetical protein
MSSPTKHDTNRPGPAAQQPAEPDTHTKRGAPTDRTYEDAGDGTLTGSVPAGLTVEELREQARSNKTVDGGTG